MKIKEIRAKTTEEINKDIKNLKEEYQRLRFRKVTDELEDQSVIKTIRKDVARLKTILREREITASNKTQTPKEKISVQPQGKRKDN